MLNSIRNRESLSYKEYDRYAKQIIIESIRNEGQNRLKAARVICIGAGGLNSSTLLYLVACGIGTIGIIDDDIVEISNLQRQIIYKYSDIKRKKVDAAREILESLNPLINIESYNKKINEENIVNILSNYEIIIDGTDNFRARYIISQYCYQLHKVHIYGAIEKFTGQVSVFNYQNSVNYYDLYRKIAYTRLQKCSETGIVNTLAGIIGLLQATEAIKIIVGIGKTTKNHLIVFSLLSCSLNKIKIRSSKLLNQKVTKSQKKEQKHKLSYISAKSMLIDATKQYKLIDIRTSLEFQINGTDNAINIPLNILKKHKSIKQIKKILKTHHIVIYCHNTTRSYIASQILHENSVEHYILDNRKKQGKKGIRTLVK